MANSVTASTSTSTSNLKGERQSLNPLATSFNPIIHSSDTVSSEDHYARARTLSPHTRSISGSSDYSFDSILPSISSFRSTYLISCFVSFFFCLTLFIVLALFTRDRCGSSWCISWADIGLGAGGYLISEASKEVIFEFFTLKSSTNRDGILSKPSVGLATAIYALLQELIRLGAITLSVSLLPEIQISPAINNNNLNSISNVFFKSMPLPPNIPRGPSLPPLDPLFFSVLFLSLGWSFTEIFYASRQFLKHVKLYDDVLEEFDEEEEEEREETWTADQADEGEEEYVLTGGGVYRSNNDSAVIPQGEVEEDYTRRTEGGNYGSTHSTSRINSGSPIEHKSLQFLTNSAFDRVITGPLAREEEEEQAEAKIRRIEREALEETLGMPLYNIPLWIVLIWRLDSILLSIDLSLLLSLPFRTTTPTLLFFPLYPTLSASIIIHVLLSLLWVLGIKIYGIPSISYFSLVTLVFALFAVLGLWGALE